MKPAFPKITEEILHTGGKINIKRQTDEHRRTRGSINTMNSVKHLNDEERVVSTYLSIITINGLNYK